MKSISIIILGLFLFGCSSNNICDFVKTPTTLEELNLNGSVESLIEFSYNAIDSSGSIIKGIKGRGIGLYENKINGTYYTNDKKVIFNESGNIVELIQYDKHSNIESIIKFNYNEFGQLKDQSLKTENGETRSNTKYSYNEQSQLVLTEFFNHRNSLEETYEYSYDCNNRSVETNIRMPNGESEMRFIESFNTEGLGYKQEISMMGSKHSVNEIEYNSKKLITKKSHIYVATTSTNEFSYDSLDNVILRIDKTPIESTSGKWTYEYTYDKNNNWIKRLSYKDSIPMFIVERSIKYK